MRIAAVGILRLLLLWLGAVYNGRSPEAAQPVIATGLPLKSSGDFHITCVHLFGIVIKVRICRLAARKFQKLSVFTDSLLKHCHFVIQAKWIVFAYSPNPRNVYLPSKLQHHLPSAASLPKLCGYLVSKKFRWGGMTSCHSVWI